jgi:predicted DNA-binding transcriptional regulator YafY
MTQPATRLITLIMLLQSQPNQKAADLAEKLGISVRTLHRYFTTLDDLGRQHGVGLRPYRNGVGTGSSAPGGCSTGPSHSPFI